MTVGLRRILVAVLAGVVVYGAFVAYTGVDKLERIWGSFRGISFLWAVGLASLNYALRFAKWQYYLKLLGVRGVRPGHSALVFLSGFVLTVTPGKVGEVFKSMVLERTAGVRLERTAPVVLAERLTDVIAIVVLVALGSAGFDGGGVWALGGMLASLVGLSLLVWPPPLEAVCSWCEATPRFVGVAPRIRAAVSSLRIVARPSALPWPVALSVVGWGLEGFALHLLLLGLGFDPGFAFSLFFYSTATLAGALIPVPGGLGVTETLILEQLVHVAGCSEPVATAAMIMIRLATLWWAVLVGFAALALLRMSFPDLLQAQRPSRA